VAKLVVVLLLSLNLLKRFLKDFEGRCFEAGQQQQQEDQLYFFVC
jgi:hypothetical protein